MPSPSRIGRKTKLTPALKEAIVRAVAAGAPYYQACLVAGVPHSTATLWRERGEHGHSQQGTSPRCIAFVAAIKKAEAQDEVRRLLRITQIAEGGAVTHEKVTIYPDGREVREVQRTAPQWQPHAWVLERKFPERYGRRLQADLTLQIQKVAQEVADEVGIDVALVLREAQDYLREKPRGSTPR